MLYAISFTNDYKNVYGKDDIRFTRFPSFNSSNNIVVKEIAELGVCFLESSFLRLESNMTCNSQPKSLFLKILLNLRRYVPVSENLLNLRRSYPAYLSRLLND